MPDEVSSEASDMMWCFPIDEFARTAGGYAGSRNALSYFCGVIFLNDVHDHLDIWRGSEKDIWEWFFFKPKAIENKVYSMLGEE